LKKFCYKVFYVKTVSGNVARRFTGLTIGAQMVGGGRPLLYGNFYPGKNGDFQSIFARSISAVTPIEKVQS